MLLLFLHSILFEQFIILWHTITYIWLICKQSISYLIYATFMPFISKSDSSTSNHIKNQEFLVTPNINSKSIESSPRYPWIEGSNPGGNYTSSSVSRKMNPFSSEKGSFCTLKQTITQIRTDKYVNFYKYSYKWHIGQRS